MIGWWRAIAVWPLVLVFAAASSALLVATPCSVAAVLEIPVGSDTPNVRIVDYGADMCGYVLNPYRNQSPFKVRHIAPFLDKDQDGSLKNDTVSGWQFSLTEPLNFPFAPLYDLRQKNARLYGGLMMYAVNNPDRYPSEGMLNANHESRDDFNFMGLGANRPIPSDEKLEAYALWFWQKNDFLNNGNEHVVTFNDSSYIAVHVSRYWGGVDAGHWVVRDGDQFYVSQCTFAGRQQLIDGTTVVQEFGKQNPMTRRTFVLNPIESEWAVYDPQEATEQRHSVLDFCAESADFRPHVFQNVTAAGFLVTRSLAPTRRAVWNNLSRHQAIAVKWHAFRCDAVVQRPIQPGYVVPLHAASARHYISDAPVSFYQWETIRRIGVTNQHCRGLGDLGYAFLNDGVLGAMEEDDAPHTTDEPVAGITWLDAVAFCNLLSEYEGVEPVYYSDPLCTKVLRRVVNRSQLEKHDWTPTVYWQQNAAGFRLPLRSEVDDESAFCWDKPASAGTLWLARDRGARSKASVEVGTCKLQRDPIRRLRDSQLKALLARELTMVTLPVGLATAEDNDPFGVFTASKVVSIAKNSRFAGKITQEELDRIVAEHAPPDISARTAYELDCGRAEVSYRVWNAVRNWAESHGYRFNYRGDMGSMRCLFAPHQRFMPGEPVTHISWHDALVWCNALSEFLGRRPVYYNDREQTKPYRQAVRFRLAMYEKPGYPILPKDVRAALQKQGTPPRAPDTGSAILIFQDAEADGYRLPYVQEFAGMNALATRSGVAGLAGQTVATAGTAMRTRSTTAGEPSKQGLYELNGSVLEWAWSPLDSYLDVMGKYAFNGHGCFSMTAQQVTANRKPYLDVVYNARPYYGLRVVCRPRR